MTEPESTGGILGTFEDRATRMGWVPEEQFKGDPKRWVDAETYVRNAENVMPHLKGSLNKMEIKMAAQEETIAELRNKLDAVHQDMTEFVKFSRDAESRAYDKAIKDLQAKQRQAVADSDTEAFDRVTADLDQLVAQHPAVTGKKPEGDDGKKSVPGPAQDPEYKAWLEQNPKAFDNWVGENKWYNDEPEMYAYANQMDSFLHKKHGFKLSQEDRLAQITDLVKERFPEKFENPNRRRPAAVSDGGEPSPGGSGKQTYANLPPEEKALCDKWAGKDGKGESGTIPGFTREQFVRDYKW